MATSTPGDGQRRCPSATLCAEERRQRIGNTPDGPFREQLDAALYLNSPYGRPVIGWEHEIAALDPRRGDGLLPRALRPEQRHPGGGRRRRPRRRSSALADGAFRADPGIAGDRAARPPAGAAAAGGAAPEMQRRPRARALRCRAAISRRSASPATSARRRRCRCSPSFSAASGITSVMARELHAGRRHRARRPAPTIPSTGLDPQSFGLYVVPKPGVGLGRGRGGLDALLARLHRRGAGPGRARAASRRRIRASEIYALDGQESRARRIGAALASGLTLEDVAAWPDLLQAVTPARGAGGGARGLPARGVGDRLADCRPTRAPRRGASRDPRHAPRAARRRRSLPGRCRRGPRSTITPVTSPGGITAWLYEEHTIPIINIEASFQGGAALDPAGQRGRDRA